MRTKAEIQRAHDLLAGIDLGEVPHPCPQHRDRLVAALDVLCWVLGHDHNPRFGENIAKVEKALADAGFRLGTEPRKVPWQKEE